MSEPAWLHKTLKYGIIPLSFILLLYFTLPFRYGRRVVPIPYILEFGFYGKSIVPGLLGTLYGTFFLATIFVLIGKVPLFGIPFLSCGLTVFATDYWEYPYFLVLWIPMYHQQVLLGERHVLSFLWSSSFFHLYGGLFVLMLLEFNITKKKVFLFLIVPWIMWVRSILFPISSKTLFIRQEIFRKLGPIVVPGGVRVWMLDRIICCLVLLCLLNDVKLYDPKGWVKKYWNYEYGQKAPSLMNGGDKK